MQLKRIPIKTAREIALTSGYDQVIIVALSSAINQQHVITFGRSTVDADHACQGGNYIKKHFLNWPASECLAEPLRVRKLRMRIKELESKYEA